MVSSKKRRRNWHCGHLITKIMEIYHEKSKTKRFPNSNHRPNYFKCFILWSCYITTSVSGPTKGQKVPADAGCHRSWTWDRHHPSPNQAFLLTSPFWWKRHRSRTQESAFPSHVVVLGSSSLPFSYAVNGQVTQTLILKSLSLCVLSSRPISSFGSWLIIIIVVVVVILRAKFFSSWLLGAVGHDQGEGYRTGS